MKASPSLFGHIPMLRTLLTALLLASPALSRAAAADNNPKAPAAGGAAVPKAHVLEPTEKINVSVENEPDCLRTVIIDEKGTVDLYLIGTTKVGGLTVEQAARAIEKAYMDGFFLRKPKVSIAVEFRVVHTVNVSGQVRNPGKIALPPDQPVDIVDVIQLAGNFTDTAKDSAVTITRIMEDGTSKKWVQDVGAIIKGRKDRKEALAILPDDIIYVDFRLL